MVVFFAPILIIVIQQIASISFSHFGNDKTVKYQNRFQSEKFDFRYKLCKIQMLIFEMV